MPKSNNLQQTLWDIQKRFGDAVINPLSSLRSEREAIPTGFPAVDALLSGHGLPCAAVTELVGQPTSGVTTLTQRALASAQGSSKSAVYLDLAGTFDPDYAALCGVDLTRLLIVAPASLGKALEIARDFVRLPSTGIIVIDALATPTAGVTSSLKRLHEAVLRSRCAVLLLIRSPLAVDADTFIHTRLHLQRTAWLYEGDDINGYSSSVRVTKDKRSPGARAADIDLRVDRQVEGGAQ
jgi:recombination protein RecA